VVHVVVYFTDVLLLSDLFVDIIQFLIGSCMDFITSELEV